MKREYKIFLAIWFPITVIVGYFTFRSTPPQGRKGLKPIAELSLQQGSVQFRPETELVWRNVGEKHKFYEWDNISTGARSGAKIDIYGIGTVSLAPDTQIKLMLPQNKKGNFELALMTGEMRVEPGQAVQQENQKITKKGNKSSFTNEQIPMASKLVVKSGTQEFELSKAGERLTLELGAGEDTTKVKEAVGEIKVEEYSTALVHSPGSKALKPEKTVKETKENKTDLKLLSSSVVDTKEGADINGFLLALDQAKETTEQEPSSAENSVQNAKLSTELEDEKKAFEQNKARIEADKLHEQQKKLQEKMEQKKERDKKEAELTRLRVKEAKEKLKIAEEKKKIKEAEDLRLAKLKAEAEAEKQRKAMLTAPEVVFPLGSDLVFLSDKSIQNSTKRKVKFTIAPEKKSKYPEYWQPFIEVLDNSGNKSKNKIVAIGKSVPESQVLEFSLNNLIAEGYFVISEGFLGDCRGTIRTGAYNGTAELHDEVLYGPEIKINFKSLANLDYEGPIDVWILNPSQKSFREENEWIRSAEEPLNSGFHLKVSSVADFKKLIPLLMKSNFMTVHKAKSISSRTGIFVARDRKMVAWFNKAPSETYAHDLRKALGADVVYAGSRDAYIGDLKDFKEQLAKNKIPEVFYVLSNGKFIEINRAFMQVHPSVGKFLNENGTAFFREPVREAADTQE